MFYSAGRQPAWITEEVAIRHADLIVIATHDRSGPNRWLHGSVAEEVVSHAGVPVMLVRATEGVPALVRHAHPAYRVGAAPPKLPDVVVAVGGEEPLTRVASLDTPHGHLLVRDLCPPSLLERMHPDPGLAAFTRRPEREHAVLLRVAQTGHGSVAIAHTETGVIVGDLVLSTGAGPGPVHCAVAAARDPHRETIVVGMSLTDRELCTVIHEMGLGALFLLDFAGGLVGLWSLRPESMTVGGLGEWIPRLAIGTLVMAVVAWATVLIGTYMGNPW